MRNYTPTTSEVRGDYAWKSASIVGALEYTEGQAEFDRWLAAHEAKVKSEVFNGLAGYFAQSNGETSWPDATLAQMMSDEADKLDKGND